MEKIDFESVLKTVMKCNGYEEDMVTVSDCDKHNLWTPCDLILREYLNNGGGSAKGFLGISQRKCVEAYHYIRDNIEMFIEKDMVSECGFNNCGFSLWKNFCR